MSVVINGRIIDLDTPFMTTGPMGHSISMTLRDLILGDREDIQSELFLGTASEQEATAFIANVAASVTPVHLAGGFALSDLVAGAAAGHVTVNGIKLGDELNEVIWYKHGDVGVGTAIVDILDLTHEFTIFANNVIENTSQTSTLGHKLLVRWTKRTA